MRLINWIGWLNFLFVGCPRIYLSFIDWLFYQFVLFFTWIYNINAIRWQNLDVDLKQDNKFNFMNILISSLKLKSTYSMSWKIFSQERSQLQNGLRIQVQVHCRNIPRLHKFSVFRFAKENIANSARNVRKVRSWSRPPEIRSFVRSLFEIPESRKKIRNRRTRKRTGQKTPDEETKRRQRAEHFEKRYAFRHASVCTAYVHRRKCSR